MSVSARLHSVGTLFDKEPKEEGDEENKNNEEDELQGQQYFCTHTPAIIIATPDYQRTLSHRMNVIGNRILCRGVRNEYE